MSKYVYTTVYESFTGSKPPYLKEHRPKRKSGCGHPYRMRLNSHPTYNPDENNDKTNHDSGENDSNIAYTLDQTPANQESYNKSTSPKVTYKKKRYV